MQGTTAATLPTQSSSRLAGPSGERKAVAAISGSAVMVSYRSLESLHHTGSLEKRKHDINAIVGYRDAESGEQCLASGHLDKITLWNLKARQKLAVLKGHESFVILLAVFTNADDGEVRLASGANDGIIKLWNLKTQQELATLTAGNSGSLASLVVFANADNSELCPRQRQ